MSSNGNLIMWLIVWLIVDIKAVTLFHADYSEAFPVVSVQVNLSPQALWEQNGVIIIGNTEGESKSDLSGLDTPYGITISSSDVLYISDENNHRIVVVPLACEDNKFIIGSGPGSGSNQFNQAHDVFTSNTSLYVIDAKNYRLQQMSLDGLNPTTALNLSELGWPNHLYIDNHGNIYISDHEKHVVRLFYSNSTSSKIVAGNNGGGLSKNQLNGPGGIFVDHTEAVYVAEIPNHRVTKWKLGASEGVCVAGNGTSGRSASRLHGPSQVIIDTNGYMYITEEGNSRITRWAPNSTTGECIVGCSDKSGSVSNNQLTKPSSFAFDSNGSLYVSDKDKHRVKKFQILTSEHQTTELDQLSISSICAIKSTTKDTLSTALTSVIPSTASVITTSYTTVKPSTIITSLNTFATSSMTASYRTEQRAIHSFVPTARCNSTNIGLNCNISNSPCDLFKPCQNNGTCKSADTVPTDYSCSCPFGFNGSNCENDYRICRPNTCWNNGTCNNIANDTFNCTCPNGWEGKHCQTKVNYCHNITCQNRGVCRPLFLNYTCECLGDSYSGRHCEKTSRKIILYKIVSTSFAYIGIIAMVSVAMFVVIMDILKYCFAIDPTREELNRIRREKRDRRRKPVIQRFIYVNKPPTVPSSTETMA